MDETLKRIEKKYFILREEKKDFIRLIKKDLGLEGNKYDKEYSGIQSIYYESNHFECYEDHFSQDDRFKIRVRNYAPDGDPVDYSFVEIKHKLGLLTDKQRFKYQKVTKDDRLTYFDPRKSSNPLTCGIVNQHLHNLSMVPFLSVSYDRVCYENANIRITVDTDLKTKALHPIPDFWKDYFKSLPMWSYAELLNRYYDAADFLIVEIKDPRPDEAHLPLRLQEFLKDKRQQFSKYCYGITKEIKS